MALITCPDCSSEIPDEANACPKCGRPSEEAKAEERRESQKKHDEGGRCEKGGAPRRIVSVVAFAILMVNCKDKAEPDYKLCVQLANEGQYGAAKVACENARVADTYSPSGEAATLKLKEIEPALKKRDEESARETAEAVPRVTKWSSATVVDALQRQGLECAERRVIVYRPAMDDGFLYKRPFLDTTMCRMPSLGDPRKYGFFVTAFKSAEDLRADEDKHDGRRFVKDNFYLEMPDEVPEATWKIYQRAVAGL